MKSHQLKKLQLKANTPLSHRQHFWKGEVPEQGKTNSYRCQVCRRSTNVRHIDEGVTPFFIDCVFCGGMAQSSMYQCDQSPEHIHAVWAKEPNSDWGDDAAQQWHIDNGGVFLWWV